MENTYEAIHFLLKFPGMSRKTLPLLLFKIFAQVFSFPIFIKFWSAQKWHFRSKFTLLYLNWLAWDSSFYYFFDERAFFTLWRCLFLRLNTKKSWYENVSIVSNESIFCVLLYKNKGYFLFFTVGITKGYLDNQIRDNIDNVFSLTSTKSNKRCPLRSAALFSKSK